jgi:hypothetical protein
MGIAAPWVTHEAPRWPGVIGVAIVMGSIPWLVLTRSSRTAAWVLIVVCVAAFAVYGRMIYAHGPTPWPPQRVSDWVGIAIVVTVPIAGLVLAGWILERNHAAS